MNRRRPIPAILAFVALSLPAIPAHAQHQGHTMPMPGMTMPMPAAPKNAPAKKPAVKKPAPKKPAISREGGRSKPSRPQSHTSSHATPETNGAKVDHSSMDHSGMDMAGQGDQEGDLPPAAEPRTPIPTVSEEARAAAFPTVAGHAAHDRKQHSYWLMDRLEVAEDGASGWEARGWVGGDIDRVWFRTEGQIFDGTTEGSAQVLYGHSTSPWWDLVAGLRQDFGHGPSQTWLAIGTQGLAPYKFEVEATAFLGQGGRTAARFEIEYDTLLTNRLILQWRGEANLYGRRDPLRGVGSGLSTIDLGMRLRYEVTRKFAPYIGIELERALGDTAELRRAAGEPANDTRLVAGLRFWF